MSLFRPFLFFCFLNMLREISLFKKKERYVSIEVEKFFYNG